MYDFLVAGAGIWGSTFARVAADAGKSVLVIDRRPHVAGNCHTEVREGVVTHLNGPHLFHTNNKTIWNFVNKYAEFNHYRHKVRANYQGRLYSFPINLMTLYQVWGVKTPAEAAARLKKVQEPSLEDNLEAWCLSQVGQELYELFIRHYTTKQWGRDPGRLPASIIKRLPVRLTHDDGYFDDVYQGVPVGGYTPMIGKMLEGIPVELNTDLFSFDWRATAKKLVYTGPIDRYFDHKFGRLAYRTLTFDHQVMAGDFQGVGQVNYTSPQVPYTRTTEHKHFEFGKQDKTVVTWEYPAEWTDGAEPYYPVGDDKNKILCQKYQAERPPDVIFGGRLGAYQYMDMHQAVASAITAVKKELS